MQSDKANHVEWLMKGTQHHSSLHRLDGQLRVHVGAHFVIPSSHKDKLETPTRLTPLRHAILAVQINPKSGEAVAIKPFHHVLSLRIFSMRLQREGCLISQFNIESLEVRQ